MFKTVFLSFCLYACLWLPNLAFAKNAPEVKVQEGLILAAFGTSVPEAKIAFQAVETAFKKHFTDIPIVWIYTSQIIRKKLAKQGEHILGISEALDNLAKQGIEVVRVQPLHVLAGEEFTELERALLLDIAKHPKRFKAVYLGRPLMESTEDAQILGQALVREAASKRKPETALVLMGHGQEQGRAGLAFEGVRAVFSELAANIFMATVEGQRDFETLLKELKAHHIKQVLLRPLMVVAGDHARNDMSGPEEDSWASRLKASGFEVSVNLEGLGVLPEVGSLYIKHALESKDDLVKEPKKQ
ncbi:MAG: sirohydrochlorin cobaltochelatase [Desulfovibrionaceae bacterium]|nr:sirohydrochlorin cobaltochelatase [Desulfovibrionaceae bacterium]